MGLSPDDAHGVRPFAVLIRLADGSVFPRPGSHLPLTERPSRQDYMGRVIGRHVSSRAGRSLTHPLLQSGDGRSRTFSSASGICPPASRAAPAFSFRRLRPILPWALPLAGVRTQACVRREASKRFARQRPPDACFQVLSAHGLRREFDAEMRRAQWPRKHLRASPALQRVKRPLPGRSRRLRAHAGPTPCLRFDTFRRTGCPSNNCSGQNCFHPGLASILR
jgi:hypothetical protein